MHELTPEQRAAIDKGMAKLFNKIADEFCSVASTFERAAAAVGTLAGMQTTAKPHTGGIVTAADMDTFLRRPIAAHIERVRVAPGKLAEVDAILAAKGGVTYKRDDQKPGTVDWSNFGGIKFVEDRLLSGYIGAMDWSDGGVEFFDWTPKKAED